MSENLPLQRIRTFLLAVIALVCLGFVLHVAEGVILPFVLAFFAMILLSPLVAWMGKRGVPSWIAVPAALVTVALLLLVIGLAFYLNLDPIIKSWPDYQRRGLELIGRGLETLDQWNVDKQTRDAWLDSAAESIRSVSPGTVISFTTGGVTSFMAFLGQGVLVLLYLMFMLFEASRFHEKAEKAFGADSEVFPTLRAISHDVKIYILVKTTICLITGLLTALVCTIFGVDFPLFWGTLAFGLNYIPNLGSVVASILPALLALFLYDSPLPAIGLLATLMLMQNVLGSLIEPRLMGRSLSISPLLLLLSLVFWGWLWGVVGMILAVPIAVTIKIVCHHTSGLEPVSTMFEA